MPPPFDRRIANSFPQKPVLFSPCFAPFPRAKPNAIVIFRQKRLPKYRLRGFVHPIPGGVNGQFGTLRWNSPQTPLTTFPDSTNPATAGISPSATAEGAGYNGSEAAAGVKARVGDAATNTAAVENSLARLAPSEIEGLRAIGLSDSQISERISATGGDLYVFRGTRSNAVVIGGEGSEGVGITPVTIDPLRATIFALAREGMDGVPSSVFFGSKNNLGFDLVKGNTPFDAPTAPLLQLEMELGVPVTPSVFAQKAPYSISAKESVDILNSMGLKVQSSVFQDISGALRSYPAMTPAQVAEYIRRATVNH
jgi:hypothetical protein